MSVSAARARLVSKAAWDPTTGRGKTKRRGAVGAPSNVSLGRYELLGLPQTQRRTLGFCVTMTFNPSAATQQDQYLRLNDAYSIVGGTSANGYARYMQMYSKAWVLRSKWLVKIQRVTTSGTPSSVWHATVTSNTTALPSMEQAVMDGLCKWEVMSLHPDRITLQGDVDHSKFLNKPRYLDDPQLFCTASASPTQLIVLHIGVMEELASQTFHARVEVAMDVVFTDPIPFT